MLPHNCPCAAAGATGTSKHARGSGRWPEPLWIPAKQSRPAADRARSSPQTWSSMIARRFPTLSATAIIDRTRLQRQMRSCIARHPLHFPVVEATAGKRIVPRSRMTIAGPFVAVPPTHAAGRNLPFIWIPPMGRGGRRSPMMASGQPEPSAEIAQLGWIAMSWPSGSSSRAALTRLRV